MGCPVPRPESPAVTISLVRRSTLVLASWVSILATSHPQWLVIASGSMPIVMVSAIPMRLVSPLSVLNSSLPAVRRARPVRASRPTVMATIASRMLPMVATPWWLIPQILTSRPDLPRLPIQTVASTGRVQSSSLVVWSPPLVGLPAPTVG